MAYGDPRIQRSPSGGLGALKRLGRRGSTSSALDAFQKYDDWFGGTRESNIGKGKAIDTEVADAMKGKYDFDFNWNLMEMAKKGKVPTRDMFQSDAEYRYVLKRYNDIRNYIENKGTPAFAKANLEKRITEAEDQFATAQRGGIGLERITAKDYRKYKHPQDMIIEDWRDPEGIEAGRIEDMKRELADYDWSPSAGPDTPVGDSSPYVVFADGGRAGFAQGGRPGYQLGTTVTQPAQFIQDIGKDYATQLAATTAVPLPTQQFAPAVAAQTGLQQQATTAATAGLGAYQPYLTGAGAAGVAPGAAPMGAEAYAGLTGAAGLQGPMTGQQLTDYMSPYQQQVIDTSLAEFDRQAAMRQQGISDAAVGLGGYGGGREGVMQAEYQTQSDRNRAMLQAGLQQQGFTQAQGARQQDYLNRLGLAQAQQGLGSYQAGLGAATQQQLGADVGLAGRVGSANQAQAQAELDAIREANRLAAYEPLERLGMYGTGVTGLMGGYPSQYQFTSQPGPTPLQSALGIASVGGGLYGNIYGPMRGKLNT